METNLEIEFKCLINAQQYNQIKNDLFSNSQGFTQTNEYTFFCISCQFL